MIPDALPTLDKGSHSANSGKACVMEYVSVMAGEDFSDSPSCTHPLIAAAARMANDSLGDEDRQLLVVLIPRLMHANGPGISATALAGLANRRDQAMYDALARFDDESAGIALMTSMRRLDGPGMVAFLTEMLDRVDQILGRSQPAKIMAVPMPVAVRKVETTPLTRIKQLIHR
jgi:hypothetical protein